MAAFIYFVLHEQITSKQKSQTGCSSEFRCQTTPFKCLVTGRSSQVDQAGQVKQENLVENWRRLQSWKAHLQQRSQNKHQSKAMEEEAEEAGASREVE